MIKNKRIKKIIIIFPYVILAMLIFLILDLFLSLSTVKKEFAFNLLLDKKTQGFTEDMLSNLSEDNDSEISLIISAPPINSKKNWVHFTIFSTKPFYNFKLDSLKIIYNDKQKDISKKLEVKEESKSVQYDFNEKVINGYELWFFGNYEKNYKVNFYKIFKKENYDFNDEFNVQFLVDYSLDERKYSKKLDYVVECVEAPQYPPNWYMMLFPYAY